MCKFCEKVQQERDDEWSLEDRLGVESCGKLKSKRLPCTVLTGFLGSGKTTVLNRLLESSKGKRYVVIENEVGEQSIDDKLLDKNNVDAVSEADEVILMPNGCMCCRVRGDLVNALKRVIGRIGTIDGVLLELSGLSQLAPVAQTFFADPFVQRSLRLDGVLCVVDVTQSDALIGESLDEQTELRARLMREQLSLADIVLLNKVDKLQGDQAALDAAMEAIEDVNATCKVYPCSVRDTAVPLPAGLSEGRLMHLDAFSLKNAAAQSEVLQFEQHDQSHHHHESLGFSTMSVTVETGPLDTDRLQSWLEESIIKSFPEALVRYKGILWTTKFGFDERYVLQGVYGHMELVRDRMVFSKQDKKSVLVFIGPLSNPAFGKLQARLRKGVMDCVIEEPERNQQQEGNTVSGLAQVRQMAW